MPKRISAVLNSPVLERKLYRTSVYGSLEPPMWLANQSVGSTDFVYNDFSLAPGLVPEASHRPNMFGCPCFTAAHHNIALQSTTHSDGTIHMIIKLVQMRSYCCSAVQSISVIKSIAKNSYT